MLSGENGILKQVTNAKVKSNDAKIKEEVELGMKCCNEFLCGECPYEKFDDKDHHEYILRCIHALMKDINKLYFGEK